MGNQAMSSMLTAGDDNDDTSTSEIVATEVTGSHVLTIDGYSCTTRLGRNEYITSSSFRAAGHRWSIHYYPNSYYIPGDDVVFYPGYISFSLTCDKEVSARCTFSLLDEDGEPTHSCSTGAKNMAYVRMATASNSTRMGIREFISRKELEQSGHLEDDRFRIRCDIGVLKLVRNNQDAAAAKFVGVPPSDIHQHLGYLLSSGDGVDVTFEVDGEKFGAHRSILAARSPVFKAELFSPMKEGTATNCVVCVQDMEPRVFKALLHFVYNDVLPEIDEGEMMVMAQHLLVAVDRYCLERLKLICQEKLCGYIDTSSVGTMLALADRHGCHGLKKACLSFIVSGGANLMADIE